LRYSAAMFALPPIVLVMIGGAIGSAFRYHVGTIALRNLGPGYPFGTLVVNLVGGFVMGLLAGALAKAPLVGTPGEPLRLLIGVGVLGGFTTFSAFSLETANMLVRGQPVAAAAYAVCSVAGSVLMLFVGLLVTRALA
jgi:CrcB protein